MTVTVTIIGLGQIGTSIGLALGSQKDLVKRIGHDKEARNAKAAEKMGALDKVEFNLHNSVRGSDLVILSIPVDQIRDTLSLIAMDLREGAVVMDTAPVKEVIASWAKDLLPANRHYVGLTPVINPAYLQEHQSGVEAAHADLFRDGLMAIVAPGQTSSEAVKMAADLTRLLGARPLFADPVEIDSLMAATHILPQLMAAALINSTVDQPGWREGRKLAGRAYAEVTGPIVMLSEPGALGQSALLTKENVLRVTDGMIAALHAFRNDILNDDAENLTSRLERARQGREQWWSERNKSEWGEGSAPAPATMPQASDFFGRLLGLGGRSKEKK